MKKDFYQKVYEITRKIPPGRVTSYGAIARCLGCGQSSRLVGYALSCSHREKKFVPAHRVVNRNGLLTGKHHFGGPWVMQQLLENEGIKVNNDRVVNFKQHFWDPAREMRNNMQKSFREKSRKTKERL